MSGFFIKTPNGHTVHVNGNPNMSKEQAFALSVMFDEATKQFAACPHGVNDPIRTSHYGPHYTFVLQRCHECGEVTVRLMGNTDDGEMYLGTLPTRVAPYHTGAPQHGYAYYWRFDGLNHSSPPIAPAPAEAS